MRNTMIRSPIPANSRSTTHSAVSQKDMSTARSSTPTMLVNQQKDSQTTDSHMIPQAVLRGLQPNTRLQLSQLVVKAADCLYLLVCHNAGGYSTVLHKLEISDFDCDRRLFTELRNVSMGTWKGWWSFLSFLSFRTVLNIKFVKFEAYKSHLVDVRKLDDIPPGTNTEYKYDPTPMDLEPPVGDNHLMHLFQHPDHAEEDLNVIDRFPKKLNSDLNFGNQAGRRTATAWGIQVLEGTSTRRIWTFGFPVFGVGSVVVGIVWAAVFNNTQDAMAVAALIAAFGTLLIGFLQAWASAKS